MLWVQLDRQKLSSLDALTHLINEMLVVIMTCNHCHHISKIVFTWCTMCHINEVMLVVNKTCCGRCSQIDKIVFTWCLTHHNNEIMLVAMATSNCCHCISKIVFTWCMMCCINKIMLVANLTCHTCSQIGKIIFNWWAMHCMLTCNCCHHQQDSLKLMFDMLYQ